MKKYIIALLTITILLTFGCSSTSEDDIVHQRNEITVLPRPDPVKLNHIDIKIMKIDGSQYYVITPTDYKVLSLNVNKLMKYSKDSMTIIQTYEKLIRESNSRDPLDALKEKEDEKE